MNRWTTAGLLLATLMGAAPVAHAPAQTAEANSRYELIVLGVAQDGGAPHLGCTRDFCNMLREKGITVYPASVAIHDRQTGELTLIEATPAIEAQIAFLHRLTGVTPEPRRPVDRILLTHAHVGHYAGLIQLGREVASTDAIPVWVTPRFAEYLRTNGPWSQLVELNQIALEEMELETWLPVSEGLSIRAIPVPHRDEFSDTVAYQIRGPNRTVLFVPDVDSWDKHEGLLERLLEGVDIAYVDATFYDGRELPDRDLSEIPHPLITDTVRRTADRVEANPGSIRFIHLNHTNPALQDARIQQVLQGTGYHLPRRGERVGL